MRRVSIVLAVLVAGAVAIGSAAIGFADDYIKIVKRRSLGLSARWKLSRTRPPGDLGDLGGGPHSVPLSRRRRGVKERG